VAPRCGRLWRRRADGDVKHGKQCRICSHVDNSECRCTCGWHIPSTWLVPFCLVSTASVASAWRQKQAIVFDPRRLFVLRAAASFKRPFIYMQRLNWNELNWTANCDRRERTLWSCSRVSDTAHEAWTQRAVFSYLRNFKLFLNLFGDHVSAPLVVFPPLPVGNLCK